VSAPVLHQLLAESSPSGTERFQFKHVIALFNGLAKPPGFIDYATFRKQRKLKGKTQEGKLCSRAREFAETHLRPKGSEFYPSIHRVRQGRRGKEELLFVAVWQVVGKNAPRVNDLDQEDREAILAILASHEPRELSSSLAGDTPTPSQGAIRSEGSRPPSDRVQGPRVQPAPFRAGPLSTVSDGLIPTSATQPGLPRRLNDISDVLALRQTIAAWLPAEPQVPEYADPEVACVRLLILLDRLAHKIDTATQRLLLTIAIGWVFDPSLSWNRRFRAVVLVAKLCTLQAATGYQWSKWPVLAPLLRANPAEPLDIHGLLSWGVHWIIPVFVLFADDSAATLITAHTSNYLANISPGEREAAVLLFCEGLRICLVVIDEQRTNEWARNQVVRRIDRCMGWLRFAYCQKTPPTRVTQLRLLLAYLTLLHSAEALRRINPRLNVIENLSEKAGTLLSQISNEKIKTVAQVMTTLVHDKGHAWHVEAACLHEIDEWKPAGRMASQFLPEFALFFKTMLTERDDFNSVSWGSWSQIMRPFGANCPEPTIQQLAPLAEHRIPS